jgi:uncharacterized protein (UPF0261 family)
LTLALDSGKIDRQPLVAGRIGRAATAARWLDSVKELSLPRPVAVIGTLDTKGHEFAYIRDQLRARGIETWVIDPGALGQPAIGTAVMQALPIGMPKVMVSTIASGRNILEPYVGTAEVTLMHSVADIAGINVIIRKVFANAAAAVAAMAQASESVEDSGRSRAPDGPPAERGPGSDRGAGPAGRG